MVRRGTILDIGKIVSILEDTYTEEELEGYHLYLRMKISDHSSYLVLIDDTNSMCLLVERVGNFKCQFHTYSRVTSRGSSILKFGRECARYLLSNTNYTSFLSFASSRHASIFIRKLGFTPVGNIKDAGGEGVDELLFSGTKESIMNKIEDKGGM